MKCIVEIDCTPMEARQFFGLPDVQPTQAALLAELEKKMMVEMERVTPDALLKSWFSLYSQAPGQLHEMLTGMMLKNSSIKTS